MQKTSKPKQTNLLNDLTIEIEKEKMNLEATKWRASLWGFAQILPLRAQEKIVPALEQEIVESAREEWGKDTEVDFDYIACEIVVANPSGIMERICARRELKRLLE